MTGCQSETFGELWKPVILDRVNPRDRKTASFVLFHEDHKN